MLSMPVHVVLSMSGSIRLDPALQYFASVNNREAILWGCSAKWCAVQGLHPYRKAVRLKGVERKMAKREKSEERAATKMRSVIFPCRLVAGCSEYVYEMNTKWNR